MKVRLLVFAMGLALGALSLVGVADPLASSPEPPKDAARATFAGGCFWCMEPPFDKIEGVYSTTSGYAGGKEKNPSYRQVSSGGTGHTEVIQVAAKNHVFLFEHRIRSLHHPDHVVGRNIVMMGAIRSDFGRDPCREGQMVPVTQEGSQTLDIVSFR